MSTHADPSSTSPPTPFNPLFTLISSSSSSSSPTSSSTQETHHHPTVHYIFTSDPDPLEPTTRAALSSLSPSPSSSRERHIIIDLDATGTKVLNASSLSPEWQITGAETGVAPTWEGGEGEGRLMLRVEGVEVEERRGNGDREEEDEEEEGVETLVERFARRMGELRRVVEGVRRGGSLGATDYKGEGEGE